MFSEDSLQEDMHEVAGINTDFESYLAHILLTFRRLTSIKVDVSHHYFQNCILYIYSTNIGTEYFKHGVYSPFFLF